MLVASEGCRAGLARCMVGVVASDASSGMACATGVLCSCGPLGPGVRGLTWDRAVGLCKGTGVHGRVSCGVWACSCPGSAPMARALAYEPLTEASDAMTPWAWRDWRMLPMLCCSSGVKTLCCNSLGSGCPGLRSSADASSDAVPLYCAGRPGRGSLTAVGVRTEVSSPAASQQRTPLCMCFWCERQSQKKSTRHCCHVCGAGTYQMNLTLWCETA